MGSLQVLNIKKYFSNCSKHLCSMLYALCSARSHSERAERGGMMVELLLALALAAAMLPFLVGQENARVRRAENLKAAADMAAVRSALEKYMEENKRELLSSVGRNVVRVSLEDLEEFDLNVESLGRAEQFQMRVVKSADRGGRSFLQGIVVMDIDGAAPIRTREIALAAGAGAGMADGPDTFGAFGTWRTKANIWNARFSDRSLLDMTAAVVSGEEFLRRVSGGGADDATMRSDLAMGGHDITGAGSIFAEASKFTETINANTAGANRLVVENRPALDGNIAVAGEALVSGALSSDSRGIDTQRMTVPGRARFSSVAALRLWAGDLTLGGFSVSDMDEKAASLSVGGSIDMTGGRVTAMQMFVGGGGSVTPRLVVRERIEDPKNAAYFWDFSARDAVFFDVMLPALPQMMRQAARGADTSTYAYRAMSAVFNNNNATVADYARALSEIERRISAEYDRLNLE
ncbi:MAG: hypothetical protein FWG39_00520 [Alphaproteobacteria bacterium]|nr:hypothetical protein [Alphaproteobacteria bacterium]